MNVRVQLGLLIAVCLVVIQPACAQDYVSGAYQQHGYQRQPVQSGPIDDLTAYQLLPDERGFLYDLDSRLDLSVLENVKGSWVRFEVWNAEVRSTTGRTLGAKTLDPSGFSIVRDPTNMGNVNLMRERNVVQNPTELFDMGVNNLVIIDPSLRAPFETIPVRSPTTQGLPFDSIIGIRGTLGIPVTNDSWVEVSAWGIEKDTARIDSPRTPEAPIPGLTAPISSFTGPYGEPTPFALVVPLTTNGQIGNRIFANGEQVIRDRVIVYDNAFFSNYQVDAWSAEFNYVHDLIDSESGFSLKPIMGYRHAEYGEQLRFGGSFDNSSGYLDLVDPLGVPLGVLAVPVSNSISSTVRNFRNEFQVGFRSELESKWLTLGIEPKVGVGLNLVRAQVSATNVLAPGDLSLADPTLSTITDAGQTRVTRDRELEFSTTFDVGLYANLNLTDWFKLRVGYDLIWLGNVGVADHQIKYNEISTTVVDTLDPELSTTTSTSDVVLQKALKNRAIQAITIGGEIILW